MAVDPLLLKSASEQARRVASGAIDVEELLRKQRAAIDAENPTLNAFVALVPLGNSLPADGASLLSGATFAVKDNIDVAGLPTRCGLKAWSAAPAERDAAVVARLRKAGLVCLGKLNMHAMALGASNHNVDFGNAYNPRRTTHSPGGSSGGSGAAVAAGLCAIALGTDTMGSVRIPAAYCGVVGFKPSAGAISSDGVTPLCRLLDQVGILARSVEDVTRAFEAVCDDSPEAGQTGEADPHLHGGFGFAIPADLDALGLALEVRTAFEAAVQRLRAAGIQLHPLDLRDYTFASVRRAGLLLCEAELLGTLAVPLAERRDEIPPDLLGMLDFAAHKSAADLARALAVVVDAGTWIDRSLRAFDGLLLPTAAQTAFPMAGPVPAEQADLTAMANVAGGPAISLPLPVEAGALPVGLQLIGRRGADLGILRNAARFEALLA